jgi:hypothetical protein
MQAFGLGTKHDQGASPTATNARIGRDPRSDVVVPASPVKEEALADF